MEVILEEISPEELERINGGGIASWVILGSLLGAVFLIGVYDGYTRPLVCN